MKYTIETTDTGCIETLELNNGNKYTVNSERTDGGCRTIDDEFADQIEADGYDDDIIEKVYDLFDNFFALEFMELSEEF